MSWSSTHVLFWIIWGTFCAGSHPNVHFRWCRLQGSNPCRPNLNNKCRRLNDVGHLDSPKYQKTLQTTRWSLKNIFVSSRAACEIILHSHRLESNFCGCAYSNILSLSGLLELTHYNYKFIQAIQNLHIKQ